MKKSLVRILALGVGFCVAMAPASAATLGDPKAGRAYANQQCASCHSIVPDEWIALFDFDDTLTDDEQLQQATVIIDSNIAGATVTEKQVRDGKNIWPLLSGKSKTKPPHHEFYYFVRHGVLAGVREGRWKLLKQKDKKELYDLKTDIGETTNLAGRRPEIVKRLEAKMRRLERDVGSTSRKAGTLPQKSR